MYIASYQGSIDKKLVWVGGAQLNYDKFPKHFRMETLHPETLVAIVATLT